MLKMFSQMTQIVLPGMVERKRGLILNLSAFTILQPIGKFAITNATKSFVDLFSRALSYEYESEGITIQVYFISSKFLA